MAPRVRRDIWDLGTETQPWKDPAVLAYATAVAAMQKVDGTNPSSGTSWIGQAAIHKARGASVPGRLETQCQHGSWFFLPWHRMYLLRFEQILRSHMPAATAETWALPYWNYSDDASRRRLPPAFRARKLPDGTANPLFVTERKPTMNSGTPLPAAVVRTDRALRETVFTRTIPGTTAGFGGGVTGFHHGASGPFGPLEGTPHGAVHTEVGGHMAGFGTAGLDPLFWLHHCNIDRLWEQWLRMPGLRTPHRNPTDRRWLTMRFELVDKNGARVTRPVSDFLDIEGRLGYTYSGLAQPPVRGLPRPQDELNEMMVNEDDGEERQTELVGATEEPVTLAGRTQATSLSVSEPTGPAARTDESFGPPPNIYLNVEHIEGEANPEVTYGVYVNLPADEVPDPESAHYAGLLSFFGIATTEDDDTQEEAPHGMRFAFDISELARTLTEQGRWDPERLDVTFSPIAGEDELAGPAEIPPVRIGRVSLFVQ